MKILATQSRKEKNQGMNWITQHKRLSIYLRDGLACCYCGATITEGVQLTLDHIKPHSKGGNNEASNLVTCCLKCNSSRGNRSYTNFANKVAGYLNHGLTGGEIVKHIKNCTKRNIDTKNAKELITRQGSCFNVLKSFQ